MIRLIVDKAIPYVENILPHYFEVLFLSAKEITHARIVQYGAEGLIIRTVTRCDESLLSGTNIRFISTATAGTDHIDKAYCHRQGIVLSNAAGCNAPAVAQWLFAALAKRAIRLERPMQEETLGIVGVGHVGTAVAKEAALLGMKTLLCDPPLALRVFDKPFQSLKNLTEDCSILTFHVPLIKDGDYPTYHLMGDALLRWVGPNTALVNASRGAVADTSALLTACEQKQVGDLLIDCWEGEPLISRALLDKVVVATPHIAGYSAESKARSSKSVVTATAHFFGIEIAQDELDQITPPPLENNIIDASNFGDLTIEKTLLHTVSLDAIEQSFRANPEQFESLRTSYSFHREPTCWQVKHVTPRFAATLVSLGFEVL